MIYPVEHRKQSKPFEDTQDIYRFDNDFGASVIRNQYSYGGSLGLFELAVVKFNSEEENTFDLEYNTRITKDVIGWLTDDEVQKLLKRIKRLKKRE